MPEIKNNPRLGALPKAKTGVNMFIGRQNNETNDHFLDRLKKSHPDVFSAAYSAGWFDGSEAGQAVLKQELIAAGLLKDEKSGPEIEDTIKKIKSLQEHGATMKEEIEAACPGIEWEVI